MAEPLPLPDREVLAHYFDYDPETGLMKWRVRPCRNVFAGDKAGSSGPRGYLRVMLKKRVMNVHRIAWKIMTGDDPGELIDHANLDTSDNRWFNLRLATRTENQVNRRVMTNSKSGIKGVRRTYFSGARKNRPWRADIRIEGRKQFLGTYPTAAEAHAAYLEAAERAYGVFARSA